jgi:hypothetical protein
METAVPGTSISVASNVPTQKIIIQQPVRHLTGFCYHFSFIALLGGLILAIISIVRDDLTKVTFYSDSSTSYTEYCGWSRLHSYNSADSYLGSPYSFTYSKFCGDSNDACIMQKVGTAWYALLIIGIVFGGIALIAFILDFNAPLTCSLILISNLIFFGCMLADALIWGISSLCQKACNGLEFPALPEDITDCRSKWGISWILVVIAGGLSLLSIVALLASRSVPYKHY